MGISLILERTYNLDQINKVILHPEIFKVVAEYNQTPEDFKTDVNSDAWVLVKVKDEIIGVYVLHPHNSTTSEIHAHILPEFRKDYALESGSKILEWFLDTEYQKLIAQVPDIYPNVKNFCIANGFIVEGVNRKSYKKNGVVMDLTLLGITRNEIEGHLHELH